MIMAKRIKRFLIVGGGFRNNGAASMTMITVDSLRIRYPDCDIIMLANIRDVQNEGNDNYRFHVVHLGWNACLHARKKHLDLRYYIVALVRLFKKENHFKEFRQLKAILNECDGVFDISGYAISSQFRNNSTLFRLDLLDMFADYGIPYFFMPQSFGPFEYQKNKKYVMRRLRESLPKATMIFAREEEGARLLTDFVDDQYVRKSYDMVLQSRGIDKTNIFFNVPSVRSIEIKTADNNTAIIPNMRNFDHGNMEDILDCYLEAIDCLIQLGKNVYLISHSGEDIKACSIIKEKSEHSNEIVLIEEKIDNWNFEQLICQYDFTIASRYHSIVHSFRAGTPCIAFGWATKYAELLKTFGQEKYLFDVRSINYKNEFVKAIKEMNDRHMKEKHLIQEKLAEIQKTNCFEQLDF